MPFQNRVDPFGNILAAPHKGTCMGNRGILHDDRRNVKYYHKHKNWVICRLQFKDRKARTPMTPGKYTELFFLDEATALAAGHRPCAECSRPRYNEFVRLWRQTNPGETDKIDIVLHRERFIPCRKDWPKKKKTYPEILIDTLPFGTFITFEPTLDARPYLVLDDTLRPWSFSGYGDPIPQPTSVQVIVLTPPSTVRTLAAGYRPQIYPEPYFDPER